MKSIVLMSLWMISWISLPGVGAIHSIDDLEGQTHKIAARIVLYLMVLLYLCRSRIRIIDFLNEARLFVMFILLNALLLPISPNIFYSWTRLVEFSFMIGSAYLISHNFRDTSRALNIDKHLNAVFSFLTIYLVIALIIFYVNPAWGAKLAGVDADSGALKYRFGGSFLRIDLVAAMAGATLMYWVFSQRARTLSGMALKSVGIAVSLTALALAHSRAALIGSTIVFLWFYIFHAKKQPIHLAVAATAVVATLFCLPEVVDFYLRGESIENVETASGRTFLFAAVLSSNDWLHLLVGNGYLMNSINGLYFPVEEMGTSMASPHDGYLSVLLGSGIFGVILCLAVHLRILRHLRIIRKYGPWSRFHWMHAVFSVLVIVTLFDYGVWGVTSPALMIFAVIYFVTSRAAREILDQRAQPALHPALQS
jgi:hypothetical protein